MPVTPQITLTGSLLDNFGAAVLNGQLAVQLCGFGSAVPRISGTGLVARTAPINVPCPAGTFNFALWGNDVITPAGTFYTVQVLDDNGNVIQVNAYQFTGAGSFDLSTVAPFNPPPLVVVAANPVLLNPPGNAVQTIAGGLIIQGPLTVTGGFAFGGLVTVAFSATPVFNASTGESFEMTLTGNVTSSTLTNTFAGEVVTFIIIQDGTGNRTFVWPVNVKNASDINPLANSITTQAFIARANGNLYPIGPAVYS